MKLLIMLLLALLLFFFIAAIVILIVFLRKKSSGKKEEFRPQNEKNIISPDTLKKLYDGQTSVQETLQFLNLSSSEETIKILDMLKNHKVSVEDGKELLEAVSTTKTDRNPDPGRVHIRTLGTVTLIFSAFIFLISLLILPLLLPLRTHASIVQHSLEQSLKENMQKEADKVTPVPFRHTGDIRIYRTEPLINNGFFSFAIVSAILLWTISILMLIYSIGLLLLAEWGRKMGVFSSVFSIIVSSILAGICIFYLYHDPGFDRILWTSVFYVSALVFIFSLISLVLLKNRKTIDTLQKELEFRKLEKTRSLSGVRNRFYRSGRNKMILGICGGLADYFNIDPMLIRIGTVLLALVTAAFPVILIYIVCGFIIPQESENA